MKIGEIEKLVKPLYAKKDSMHNFHHIMRIKKKLTFLKKDYKKIEKERLNFLLYFHGLKGWVEKNKNKIMDLGFDEEDINSLKRHTKNPKTAEEKLVHDANLLENVGRFGIQKSLIVGKKLGRTKEGTIDFLKENIDKVNFYTPTGKILGKKRIEIMKKFIKGAENK
jgi:hypothetical protein|tara:strand:+ start:166 stop:666 length:501 start_codon:yes stop_codon:yes gene_type:complete